MTKIVISNSTVIINDIVDSVKDARDALLTKLYWARNKTTMGGYQAWERLLEMYYRGDYVSMKVFIKSCKGRGGKTRNECIHCLDIIINSERS